PIRLVQRLRRHCLVDVAKVLDVNSQDEAVQTRSDLLNQVCGPLARLRLPMHQKLLRTVRDHQRLRMLRVLNGRDGLQPRENRPDSLRDDTQNALGFLRPGSGQDPASYGNDDESSKLFHGARPLLPGGVWVRTVLFSRISQLSEALYELSEPCLSPDRH